MTARTGFQLGERLFDEQALYRLVSDQAEQHGMPQTSRVLPLAAAWHAGQYRKGEAQIPYISHPLTVTCHALALGLQDDDLCAALLLHDVVEDCGVTLAQLPVSETVREAVSLVTKRPGLPKAAYYAGIADNAMACMVKLLDRCNNVSGMSFAFSRERMLAYLDETKTCILPLAETVRRDRPAWRQALFAVEYHLGALVNTYQNLLKQRHSPGTRMPGAFACNLCDRKTGAMADFRP